MGQLYKTKVVPSVATSQINRSEVPQIVWEADYRGMNHYQSPSWYEYIGEPVGSSYGEDWLHFCHPDDRERVMTEWRRSLAAGGSYPYDIEARLRRYDGQYRWFRVQAAPVKSQDGKVVKWNGICTDIHDSKISAAATVAPQAQPNSGLEQPHSPALWRQLRSAFRFGPLERRLFWIVLVALVPLALLCFAMLLHSAAAQKEQSTRAAERVIRSIRLEVESEIQASAAALDALAASTRLDATDFEGFSYEAKALLERRNGWSNVVLSDPAARQISNAQIPFGSPLPAGVYADAITRVARTDRTVVSDLTFSPTLNAYVFGVAVPVFKAGAVKYVLTAAIKPTAIQDIIARHTIPDGACVVILDRAGKIVARSLNPEAFVGKDPSQGLQELLADPKLNPWTVMKTLEGTPVYSIIERSADLKWTAAIGIPIEMLDRPVMRSFRMFFASLIACILLGLAAALLTGRIITKPMQELELAASTMAQGLAPVMPTTRLPEIRRAAQVLLSAHSEREKLLQSEREARQMEQQARFAAESASRAKDEFLAMLGHELRNPLAAIASASENLEHSQQVQSQEIADEAMAIVRRQLSHLTRMTDDLLDAGRVMMGKINLSRHPLDFAAAIESAIHTLRSAERLAGHTVTVQLEPLWIYADPTRMDQIVTNLLSNAIKYTPASGSISVSLRREGADAVLRVQDTGLGLEPDLLPRVFDLFVQGPRTLDREQGGLGIGLALVKRLVHLQGGTVQALSAGTGQGSEFVVRLPKIDPPAHANTEGTSTAKHTSKTIVLIEDDDDVRTSFARYLTIAGHRVFAAESGVRGIEFVRQHRPDIAIVDIGLPGMDGLQIARMLRAEFPNIKLIALTGYGSEEDIRRGYADGFHHYLVKPVSIPLLHQIFASEPPYQC